jgi:hypothetical protein
MLGLVRKSGFREYLNPFGGQGYGAGGFAWTAALTIDVLHRDRTRSGQPLATTRRARSRPCQQADSRGRVSVPPRLQGMRSRTSGTPGPGG